MTDMFISDLDDRKRTELETLRRNGVKMQYIRDGVWRVNIDPADYQYFLNLDENEIKSHDYD